MRTHCRLTLGMAAFGALALALPASGEVLYQETFPAAGDLAAAGWDTTSANASDNVGIYAEDGTGYENDRDGVTVDDGIFWQWLPNGNTESAVVTTEATIDLDTYENIVFDWDQRGAYQGAGINVHLVVQVGEAWYASDQVFPTTADTSPWDATQLAYDPAASNWLDLTLGTNTFTLGTTPASDLSGDITGFGWVSIGTEGNETVEFDQLSVTGTLIPEPASLGLLTLAGAGLLIRRTTGVTATAAGRSAQ